MEAADPDGQGWKWWCKWLLVQVDGHKRGHYEGDTVVDTGSTRYLCGISQTCHCLLPPDVEADCRE
jgi:hypothetical protein